MTNNILTKRELQIMQILWDSPTSLSVREVTAKSDNLSQNTVQTVLRKLLETGFIKVEGIGKSGTVHTRKFAAVISQEDYFKTIMSPSAIKNLVSSFIDSTTQKSELDDLASQILAKQQSITDD